MFIEEQKFRQKWLWALVVFGAMTPLVVMASGVYIQLVKGIPFGDTPMPDTTLVVLTVSALVFSAGLLILFYMSKLTVKINGEGIYYRFTPFMISYRHISPGMIKNWEVRLYSPINDFGGWGLRIGLAGKGMAYTVSGNTGLQLELNNGKKKLIGTLRPDEMRAAMEAMMAGRGE